MSGRQSRSLGKWGEDLTAEDLAKRGWRVVARNWRCRFGELDIVAERGGMLAFVEVKLRKDDRFGTAGAFVTPAKQRKLRLAAERYLQEHPTQLQPRFDVAEVYPAPDDRRPPWIDYINNAF